MEEKNPHTQYVNSHHRASRVKFSSLSQEEIWHFFNEIITLDYLILAGADAGNLAKSDA